jgi:hypothetical protein
MGGMGNSPGGRRSMGEDSMGSGRNCIKQAKLPRRGCSVGLLKRSASAVIRHSIFSWSMKRRISVSRSSDFWRHWAPAGPTAFFSPAIWVSGSSSPLSPGKHWGWTFVAGPRRCGSTIAPPTGFGSRRSIRPQNFLMTWRADKAYHYNIKNKCDGRRHRGYRYLT